MEGPLPGVLGIAHMCSAVVCEQSSHLFLWIWNSWPRRTPLLGWPASASAHVIYTLLKQGGCLLSKLWLDEGRGPWDWTLDHLETVFESARATSRGRCSGIEKEKGNVKLHFPSQGKTIQEERSFSQSVCRIISIKQPHRPKPIKRFLRVSQCVRIKELYPRI